MNRYLSGILMVTFCLLVGCDAKRVFESDYDFEEQSWHMDSIPEFSFQIEDNMPKDVILKIRNSLDFPFRNCYITYFLEDSTGLTLQSDLINLQLFDEQTGKPFGKGNSIFQHAEPILESFSFPGPGQYRLKLTHYMRRTDLVGTYSIGIRVEERTN